jgi:hypothetical protein
VVIGDRTGAASAYVSMTRGRLSNTAHLVAADVGEARRHGLASSAATGPTSDPATQPSWPLEGAAHHAPL